MKPHFYFLLALLLALPISSQKLSVTPTTPGLPPIPASLEDRRKALVQVTHDYWEDQLKHTPELASLLGDPRFNDQLSNYSAAAYNESISREQNYLLQLAVIDEAGFTDAEKQRFDALDHRLEEDLAASGSSPWQLPISPSVAFYKLYLDLGAALTFSSSKDYDDWTTRMKALPEAFAQAIESMSIGIDNGNLPPRPLIAQALADANLYDEQDPDKSPLAAPLNAFPASIGKSDQAQITDQMLDAIDDDAQTAYERLGLFLQASYLPAAPKDSPTPASATLAGSRSLQLFAAVLDLRTEAQRSQGAKFNIKAFHDAILDAGLLPIDPMKARVRAALGIAAN